MDFEIGCLYKWLYLVSAWVPSNRLRTCTSLILTDVLSTRLRWLLDKSTIQSADSWTVNSLGANGPTVWMQMVQQSEYRWSNSQLLTQSTVDSVNCWLSQLLTQSTVWVQMVRQSTADCWTVDCWTIGPSIARTVTCQGLSKTIINYNI